MYDVLVCPQSNEVKRADVRTGEVSTVADSGVASPRALALAAGARVLYYVSRGALAASGLRGECAVPLLEGAAALQTLAVHERAARLYWAMRGGDGGGVERVEQAVADGSARRELLNSTADAHLSRATSE